MKTIEEAKAAHESGQKVYWMNEGYFLRKDKSGEWWINCVNGFVSPLLNHDTEHFFTAKD